MDKKLQFEKLTLKDDINIDVYEEALDYVFESEDIRNVAISGAYGAGKSSVLAAYKKRHPDKKYLHISLAHFESEKNEEREKINDYESKIEGKILNQLIHQISSDSIPQTNFKVKQNIKTWKIFRSAALCFLMFTCIGFLYRFDAWKRFVEMFKEEWFFCLLNFTLNKYVQLSAVVLVLIIVFIFVYSIIKLQKTKKFFKRLSIQGNEIEIFESQNDSFFDKYLNEVLYLFENSKTDVIVFEDIDRFGSSQIFERLREINILANIQLAKGSENNTLRFFYLLKDDMFDSKDRTKFFDFIIPVVPVIDGTNSFDQFIEHLEKNSLMDKFDKRFLKGMSLYIDDMRLLKNVCNEFLVYYHRLNTTELNCNKMFAMIAYKNLFPRDFSDLQNGRGYVKSLFDRKYEIILSEKKKLLSLLEEKKNQIDACKKEQLNDISELELVKSEKKRILSGRYDTRREYEKWEKETYPIRKKAIENKLNGQLMSLEREANDLEHQLIKLDTRQLKDIINRENRKTIFHQASQSEIGEEYTYVEIRGNDYFALLKYLLGEGYIDETYADYMTYFYENSLSVNDKKFLRSVRDKQAKEYKYALNNPTLVMSYLNITDFEEPEILNLDLFTHILSIDGEYVERFITQLKVRGKYDFLSQYFDIKGMGYWVKKVAQIWPEFFWGIIVETAIPESQMKEISLAILMCCDDDEIKAVNVDSCLTMFISESKDYLDLSDINNVRLMEAFKIINAKFRIINYEISEKNLFNQVYEKNMYVLNYENIKNILKYVYQVDDEEIIRHKNCSTIAGLSSTPISSYVRANISEYFEIVFEICDGKIEDEEDVIIDVLNDTAIDNDIKLRYISLLNNSITDISTLKETKLWSKLLEEKKVIFSENNLYHFFKEFKTLSALLVNYINEFAGIIDLSKIPGEQDFQVVNDMFDATISCTELTNEKYKQILSSANLVYEDGFEVDDVPNEKMHILIDNEIIGMTKECLASIRNKYQNVLYHFIRHNIKDYVSIMDSELLIISELKEILSWEIEDDLKISLLELTTEKISLKNVEYSDKIVGCILSSHFLVDDLKYLLQRYESYPEHIKSIIFKLSTENFDEVIECAIELKYSFCEEIFECNAIEDERKGELFTALLSSVPIEWAKNFALLLQRFDLVAALEINKRRKIPYNIQNQKILEQYKRREWIYDYEAKEDNTYYKVIKRKR